MGKMVSRSTITFDRVADNFEVKGKKVRAKVKGMLRDGADIVVRNVKTEIGIYGLVASGDLLNSAASTREKVSADAASIDVTFIGTRTRGKRKISTERNATIGFVQQYGRSYGRTKRAGRPYFTTAVQDAEPEVTDLWRRRIHNDD